jgi:lipid A 3-O-deacylase
MIGIGLGLMIGSFVIFPLWDSPSENISEVGVDYLTPTKSDRQINTVNLNAYLWQKQYKPWSLRLKLGFTATRPTGTIGQGDGNSGNDTSHEHLPDSSAYGIGPTMELQWEALSVDRLSVDVDGSAGLILYDRHFPTGGDYYNGMYQVGPSIGYRVSDKGQLRVGYRWMHVSNGQGITPDNPSYEAIGIILRYEHKF